MPDDQRQPILHGLGQAVPQLEDAPLLRGAGRYTDDIVLEGQLHGVVVHSPLAHARIRAIDRSAALAVPGVVAVYDGRDLAAAGLGAVAPMAGVPNHDGTPMRAPPRAALPVDRVRFVGEAVAFVVAETEAAAREAAEHVALDLDPLPPVTDIDAALAPGAPALHDIRPRQPGRRLSLGATATPSPPPSGLRPMSSG